ncbi:hypothetical protein EFK50_20535 [Nocardioides marmoriginsengisoli]|uniref:DUF2537 domain-containing protein n=1 Tax=Nocardioides marmoriginsengisoli TaxID=661483 RepID=A0A3N0CB64_9ACTN|nr:hypothetical protein [Nocardioides marmoriginsengisoli]RNL60695.1 hypothetical protein EFK50_20535 [Nocardioides marmoriginsengisoli]
MTEPTKRVAKHLIDPANPPRRAVQRDDERLTRVKQWVMSVLAVTTILHLCVGLILAAVFTDTDRVDARIGLNVIAGILGVSAVAAGLAIHKKNPVSPWIALGVIPAIAGMLITFR